MTLLILQNFHVFVATGENVEKRVNFERGMTVQPADIPAGHTAADWVAKGLARDTSAPAAAEDDAPHT